MEQLIEIGLFAGKMLVIFMLILGVVLLVAAMAVRQRMRPHLELNDINEKFDETADMINSAIMDKKEYKKYLKGEKRKQKEDEPRNKASKKIFVLKFEGDIQAEGVTEFREEVTAVLSVAKPGDEVVIEIESSGGTVHGYGLCAAQILRLRDAKLTVTACVDKVAASGGYMMAATADRVVAAPFAIIGSIGVLAQVPNIHRFLQSHNVDYEELSAGEYKRTVSVFGPITEKGRLKFQEQIEDTHALFKEFIGKYRPQVDLNRVATGEYWFALRAKDLNLVDEISTSDDYLLRQKKSAQIYSLRILPKKTLANKIEEALAGAAVKISNKFLQKINESRLP